MDRNFSNFGSWRAYLAPLGAKHARLQSGWGKTEQQPGVYDFAWLDEVVDGMLAVGVTPWLQLSLVRGEDDMFATLRPSILFVLSFA